MSDPALHGILTILEANKEILEVMFERIEALEEKVDAQEQTISELITESQEANRALGKQRAEIQHMKLDIEAIDNASRYP